MIEYKLTNAPFAKSKPINKSVGPRRHIQIPLHVILEFRFGPGCQQRQQVQTIRISHRGKLYP